MSATLLVTNDFPPKVGGIQSYLWELWRRLDPATTAVLTARSHPDHASFDAEQAAELGLRIRRVGGRILFFPTPIALRRIRARPAPRSNDPSSCCSIRCGRSVCSGRRLGVPYGVVLHGAELAIPARLPGRASRAGATLRGAAIVVSAGGYPRPEAERVAGGPLDRVVEVPTGRRLRAVSRRSRRRRAGHARRRLGTARGRARRGRASAGWSRARAWTS